jgi:S1-C subfamily serine protease
MPCPRSRLLTTGILLLAAAACSGLSTAPATPTPTRSPFPPPPVVVIVTPTALPDHVLEEAGAEELLLVNLYERVNPGVVNIDVAAGVGAEVSPYGSGSGFVYDTAGYIVTNFHLVAQMEVIWVTFADGSVREAEIVGTDPFSDMAVLQVSQLPPGAVALELGDSDTLQVGQRVVAIGNPFGRAGTMTVGVISALGRTLSSIQATEGGRFSIPEVIQTDAAINPGNSGGPLLDSQGRVVGINTAIVTRGEGSAGVGFSVPVNIVRRIVPRLIEEGSYRYPYLGITWDTRYTLAQLALELGMPTTQGVLVSTVTPGGPADEAGVLGGDHQEPVLGLDVMVGGDIIAAVDDVPVIDFNDLLAYLVQETEPGQTVTLTVLRNGRELQIPVELGERPR